MTVTPGQSSPPLAVHITVISSTQRNAAFGTAWWALRLDAQGISDVWQFAFACSGRSFGDMFPRQTPFSVRFIAKRR